MQQRSTAKVIIFGFLTCGIYQLYWLYKTRLEMVAKGNRIPPLKLLLLPILLLLVVAILQFGVRFIFNTQADTADFQTGPNGLDVVQANQPMIIGKILNIASILLGLISLLAALPVSLYWYYRYCKAVERVTGRAMPFGTAFWIGIILSIVGVSFIVPGLIQDAFNKVSDNTPQPPAGYQPPANTEPPYPQAV